MDKQDIKLTDGRVIEIQVSFLTLYLIKNNNLDKETNALNRMTDKYEKMDDKSSVAAKKLHEKIEDKQFYMAAKMIYVILRSNREKVEFEDALALCPIEPDAIVNIIKQFQKKRQYEELCEEQEIDFTMNLYLALTQLNLSEDDFWHMSPITFDELLETHVEFERSKIEHG